MEELLTLLTLPVMTLGEGSESRFVVGVKGGSLSREDHEDGGL